MSVPGGLDPINLAIHVRNAFLGLRDAPGEFRQLQLQTETLKNLLTLLIERMRRFNLAEKQRQTLASHLIACQDTARQLNEAFRKYHRLDQGVPWYKSLDKRARWVVGTTRTLDVKLRDHIMTLFIMYSVFGEYAHRVLGR
jgi:hypothetical protein